MGRLDLGKGFVDLSERLEAEGRACLAGGESGWLELLCRDGSFSADLTPPLPLPVNRWNDFLPVSYREKILLLDSRLLNYALSTLAFPPAEGARMVLFFERWPPGLAIRPVSGWEGDTF